MQSYFCQVRKLVGVKNWSQGSPEEKFHPSLSFQNHAIVSWPLNGGRLGIKSPAAKPALIQFCGHSPELKFFIRLKNNQIWKEPILYDEDTTKGMIFMKEHFWVLIHIPLYIIHIIDILQATQTWFFHDKNQYKTL